MYEKVNQSVSNLEDRLSVLERNVDNLLNGNVQSEKLTDLRQDNTKLKYRLGILMRSIAEEEARDVVKTDVSSETKPTGDDVASLHKTPAKPDSGVDVTDKSILAALKKWFASAIDAAYPSLSDLPVLVTPATKEAFGDYQFNSAMAVAQAMGKTGQKTNPRSVASAILEKLAPNDSVEKLEIAGPGFINIFLRSSELNARIRSIFNDGILPPRLSRKMNIVVDFSSPNIAKEMHVGHLRSTILGDCVSRLMEWLGHDVIRVNHIGDWGTQFGMLIAHLEDRYPNMLSDMPEVSDLMILYKESKKRFDDDTAFNKRAHDCVVRLQSGEKDVVDAWKAICQKSREEFQRIYERLDVRITERGESFYQSRMDAVVKQLRDKDLLQNVDGREVLFPKGMEVPLTVVKSDGGYTYDTSDMATIKYRIDEEKGDWLIYVVDAGQSLHFQTIFAAAQEAGILDPSNVRVNHVAFGVVLGEGRKKLKTREGESIKLVSLLDEGLRRSKAKLEEKQRGSVLTPEELDAAQSAVAYGCIKYSDLVHNRINDYIFSFDRMLDDRGNTAAYLLYAYARIRSIARNAGITRQQIKDGIQELTLEHAKELKLAKAILRFWDAIVAVLDELYPHLLCDYLYDLASVFTEFYDNCYCIEKDANGAVVKVHLHRLLLCEVTADVMATCFRILGIRTVEKM